jgi:hypothetical protein
MPAGRRKRAEPKYQGRKRNRQLTDGSRGHYEEKAYHKLRFLNIPLFGVGSYHTSTTDFTASFVSRRLS